MKKPSIATTVSALNKTADQQTVDLRIADRSEVLETLPRIMRGEVEADSNRVIATQLLAQAQGLLKDRTQSSSKNEPAMRLKPRYRGSWKA